MSVMGEWFVLRYSDNLARARPRVFADDGDLMLWDSASDAYDAARDSAVTKDELNFEVYQIGA